jgi:hypothetical protein
MNLRSIESHASGAAVILLSLALSSNAQVSARAQASSASHVAAEMTNGKLNPADSKPGDIVALKLKDDLKSNGEVVLKKGTTITGVVRNVKRAELNSASKGEANGRAQSMIEIEWLAPEAQRKAAQNLSIALQSVTQVDPVYQHIQNDSGDAGLAGAALAVDGTVGAANVSVRGISRSNAALLNMPSVIAVDYQTSSAIESGLGTSSSGQLFKVGHGELLTAGGSQQSVDIFSHLSNDTVITSPSRNFEITSGAQMQLLVGVRQEMRGKK